MNLIIRQEEQKDYPAVFSLIKKAFKNDEVSDHNEQLIVEALRKSKIFTPKFSLVAKINNEVVGHILLTEISLKNESQQFISLALAPVSVVPKFQNQDIGGTLIQKAHEIAKMLATNQL